jgi:hypothetical protein
MPYHPDHARLSPTQLVVSGLLVLLLAILLLWSFQEGRERTRSEPTPPTAPTAEPSSGDLGTATPARGSGSPR